MKPVATAAEMRTCDAAAIDRYGIPGIVLMENAARGSAESIQVLFPDAQRTHVLIICGKGNNGGDGFALARHLHIRKYTVTVASVGSITSLRGDARVNADIVMKISRSDTSGRIACITSVTPEKLSGVGLPDIIVDALLGTGFRGKTDRRYSSLISWINTSGLPVVAIDIPSGVHADTGVVDGISVRAQYTLTMGLLKTGLLFSDGREAAGKTIAIDIQIPPEVFRRSGIKTFLVEEHDVREALPKRRSDVHKYKVGKVFVLGGSTGLTGAAALTSFSALKSGAGAVVLGIPKSLYPFMAKKMTEVMTIPLDESSEGVLGVGAWKAIKSQCNWADVVAVGPGLSKANDVAAIVERLIREIDKPLVIDADGINVLAGKANLFKHRNVPLLLTPHTGEFARLTGHLVHDIESDRITVARNFTSSYNIVLHLKGDRVLQHLRIKEFI
jgi:ADP-dependent NAD(P)H-hydrate dehydratase / NAD(P)H-hydrate epimerase